MRDLAIKAEGISKKYHIGKKIQAYQTLRDTLADAFVAPFRRASKLLMGDATGASGLDETMWALADVSFEVKQGEVVGIIGPNGAGKSTLLKILSRITEPTSGFIEIYGRVGSLLEVGTGFHQELTGRENIYLNGAILGMKRSEIVRKFDEMVCFAEVEKFIDTPVKHYSSGMYLRLAFAVAAHLNPEVLLVDEVLAVGDAAFQKKCLGKMRDVSSEGRTVILVSHDMSAINQLCNQAIWIDSGKLKMCGMTHKVIEAYLMTGSSTTSIWYPPSDSLEREFQFISAKLVSRENQIISVLHYNSQFQVNIEYEVFDRLKDLAIICGIADSHGNRIWTSWDTDGKGWRKGTIKAPGRYVSICKIPPCLLKPGLYLFSLGATSSERAFTGYEKTLVVEVSDVGYSLNPGRRGAITPMLEWEVFKLDSVNRVSLPQR
jgi:lipopolysaccharide transport system ATP-binding protein